MSKSDEPLTFEAIATCENPMEVEIYPAALREAEIPHRTDWGKDGSLTILVASEWVEEARATLTRASAVFFGQTQHPLNNVEQVGSGHTAARPARGGLEMADPDAELAEYGDAGLFLSDALPTPEETRLRAVWPAWALAAIPGIGLGHLYAGRFQVFFYLMFCSLLGILFFHLTKSPWSFALAAFAWAVDLTFAAHCVKEHNRRARRARKRLAQAQRRFLESR